MVEEAGAKRTFKAGVKVTVTVEPVKRGQPAEDVISAILCRMERRLA